MLGDQAEDGVFEEQAMPEMLKNSEPARATVTMASAPSDSARARLASIAANRSSTAAFMPWRASFVSFELFAREVMPHFDGSIVARQRAFDRVALQIAGPLRDLVLFEQPREHGLGRLGELN